jgi:hypothetical protein
LAWSGKRQVVVNPEVEIFDVVGHGHAAVEKLAHLDEAEVGRGGPTLPLLVQLVAVEEMESFADLGLCEVVVETIRRDDRGAGQPVEGVPHPVILALGERFLHDLAELVEAKVDLLPLGLLLLVAIEEGDRNIIIVGRREDVLVGAEDRPALLDHGSLLIGNALGEAVGLAVARDTVGKW